MTLSQKLRRSSCVLVLAAAFTFGSLAPAVVVAQQQDTAEEQSIYDQVVLLIRTYFGTEQMLRYWDDLRRGLGWIYPNIVWERPEIGPRPSTPELNGDAAGAAVLLAVGGVLAMTGRRRKLQVRTH